MKFTHSLSFSALALSTVLFTSQASADAVTVEDVNLDNIPDVVVSETGGQQPKVFLGNGDGTFASPTTPADKPDPVYNTAKIMKKDKSQVALTLNKNLSIDILGVRAGKKVKPCGKENPCRFDPKTDKDNIFAQKSFNITVFKGSCCAHISTGDMTYEYCSPQYPVAFINLLTGAQCQ